MFSLASVNLLQSVALFALFHLFSKEKTKKREKGLLSSLKIFRPAGPAQVSSIYIYLEFDGINFKKMTFI